MIRLFKEVMRKTLSGNISFGERIVNPLEGEFKLESIENGISKTEVYEKNLIVNSSFDIISSLLVSASSTKKIDTIKVGNGGIINSVLQSPTLNDTSLYNEVYSQTGTSGITVESILDKYIEFRFLISKSDGNGSGANIYNEAGLSSNDGTLYARKTFTEVIKTPEKEILISWKIKFS